MTVVKKSGSRQEFLEYKLENSLIAANKGTGELLNVKNTMTEFKQITEEKTEITTWEIMIIIYGLLYTNGLLKTLESYSTYDKK